MLDCFKRDKKDLKKLVSNCLERYLNTVLSIPRKYQVGRGVRQQGAKIFTGASSSGDTGHVVGRRHACHAPDLSRRAADAHEVPDTSDNNLSRSDSADSAGTMPPPRIADPARYVIGCCSCCFSRRALFLSLFLPFSRTPFLLCRCPSCVIQFDFFLYTLVPGSR